MAHWTHSTQLSGKMYCGATAGTYYALFSQTSSFIIADGQGVCRRTRRPPFSGYETSHFKVTPLTPLLKPIRMDFCIDGRNLDVLEQQSLTRAGLCFLLKSALANKSRAIVPYGSPPNWDYWSLMLKMYFVHELKL